MTIPKHALDEAVLGGILGAVVASMTNELLWEHAGDLEREKLFHSCEWQQHGLGEWVFGLKVLGVVREPYYARLLWPDSAWKWSCSLTNDSGEAATLDEALTAAETVLKKVWKLEEA
jgi:hypothetical protein